MMLLTMLINFKIFVLCKCSWLLSSETVGRVTAPEIGAGIKTLGSHWQVQLSSLVKGSVSGVILFKTSSGFKDVKGRRIRFTLCGPRERLQTSDTHSQYADSVHNWVMDWVTRGSPGHFTKDSLKTIKNQLNKQIDQNTAQQASRLDSVHETRVSTPIQKFQTQVHQETECCRNVGPASTLDSVSSCNCIKLKRRCT